MPDARVGGGVGGHRLAQVERDEPVRPPARGEPVAEAAGPFAAGESEDGDGAHDRATNDGKGRPRGTAPRRLAATIGRLHSSSGAPSPTRPRPPDAPSPARTPIRPRPRRRPRAPRRLRARAGGRRPEREPEGRGHSPDPRRAGREGRAYTEFRPTRLASWHPVKRELVVAHRARQHDAALRRARAARRRRCSSPTSPNRCATARGGRRSRTCWCSLATPAATSSRSSTGSSPGAKEPVLLTDPARTHRPAGVTARATACWSRPPTSTRRAAGARTRRSTSRSSIRSTRRRRAKIATLPGTGWGDFQFSFDDRRLAMNEFKSVTETYVWVMDLATGERRRVLPAAGADAGAHDRVDRGQLRARRQGAVPDDRPRRRVPARGATSTSRPARLEPFGPANWDVEQLALSPDGRTLALVVNEAGVGVLRLYDADTRRELPRPRCRSATVSGVQWHHDSTALAFNLDSAQSPGDVYVLDVARQRVTRWTESKVEGLDASRVPPCSSRSTGRASTAATITGFIASPPAKFAGRAAGDDPHPRRAGRRRRGRASSAAGTTSSTSWASRSSSPTCAARPATARPSSRSTTA